MLDFIRCPECGHPIGAVYEAYRCIATHRYTLELEKKKSHIIVANTGVIDFIQISMKDIFEQLGIQKYCCRQRLITNMDFHEAQFI